MKEGYKNSSLGDIPNEWDILPLKELANNKKHSFIDGDWIESPYIKDDGVRLIQTGNIGIGNFIDRNKKYISEESFEELKCKDVFEGDLLICRLAAPVGRACIVPNLNTRNITSVDVTICRPSLKVDKIYLMNYLNYQPTLFRMENLSGGSTRQRINRTNLGKLEIPLPPLPEQQKIAEILSTVDEKIDSIAQRIAETQELKKGLMQQLLTKGIGHTKFKDSPLGEIPESWEVLSFGKLISNHCYGPRFSSKDYSESGNVKTIRGTDINKSGDILYNQVPIAQLPNELVDSHKLEDGDLVMITTADCGLTGVYFDDGFPYIASAYAVRISLNEKGDPYFFKYVFQTESAKRQVEKYIRKGTVANLPGSDILKFSFAIPPIEEQKEIAEILSTVDEKIQIQHDKKVEYQELKKGLMQQLLTGKMRVRIN